MAGLRTMKKRRRECKTDYRLRMSLLKSGVPRIVIRRTNKYFIIQAIESKEAQDAVLATITSKDLLKKGWDKKHVGSLKSLPAAYLTGILAAHTIKKGNFIVDLGMARTIAGNRLFAAVKGLIDGGLTISADKKAFPSEDRLNGEHMEESVAKMIAKVKEKLL